MRRTQIYNNDDKTGVPYNNNSVSVNYATGDLGRKYSRK